MALPHTSAMRCERLRVTLVGALLLLVSLTAHAQAWFVDGFHGGIYGHYPKETYTAFLCDQLEAHDDWYISLEIEPETWDTIAARHPDQLERLRRWTATPRVEFANTTYAQPYLWNIGGESIIRQLTEGRRKVMHYFPEATMVTYAAEEPCFTSCLPGLLTATGHRLLVWRCPDTCWGGWPAKHGHETAVAEGPDGTRMPMVPRPLCEDVEPNSTWQTLSWRNTPRWLRACHEAGIAHPVGMTFQDAGWTNGPWMGTESIYTTWSRYVAMTGIDTTDVWHLTAEDLRPNLMWGSEVMNETASHVRQAENALLTAEKMTSLTRMAGWALAVDTIGLNEAWRTLMLAEHHDAWIVPYNLWDGHTTWAEQVAQWTATSRITADRLTENAIRAFGGTPQAAASKGKAGIRVFNTTGTARHEVVSFAHDGHRKYCVADVPAFGYTVIPMDEALADKADGGIPCTLSVNDEAKRLVMSNGLVTMTLDLQHGGVVESLLCDGEEYAAREGDRRLGELRGWFYDEHAFRSSAEEEATYAVHADDPLTCCVEIRGNVAGSPFSLRYTLRQGCPRVDGELTIRWDGKPGIGEYRQSSRDWKKPRRAFCDDRYKLNLLLPTAFDVDDVWKNAPFDVCHSQNDSTFFGSWTDIRHNIILDWVDVTGRGSTAADTLGLCVLSDHTTSYTSGPQWPLALTAMYSGVGLWGRDYTITRPLHFRFALLPHKGLWDEANLEQQRVCWNEPLIVSPCPDGIAPQRLSLIDLGRTGLEITSVCPTSQGVAVRLYNAEGRDDRQTVIWRCQPICIAETDLMDNTLRDVQMTETTDGVATTLSLPRHGVTTLHITLPDHTNTSRQ